MTGQIGLLVYGAHHSAPVLHLHGLIIHDIFSNNKNDPQILSNINTYTPSSTFMDISNRLSEQRRRSRYLLIPIETTVAARGI